MPHCKELDFIITGLPDKLENIDIRGLDTGNIQLKSSNHSFGESLDLFQVSKPTICKCPQAVVRMFGKPLSEQTVCGITNILWSSQDKVEFGSFDYSVGFQSKGLDSAISSCEYLIENTTLRFMLWTMAVAATVGNFAVLLYRLVYDRNCLYKSYGIFPFNLAVSDMLMGIYLFIIADADRRFRGEYVLFDEKWRHGPVCQVAGFLSTLSSETSAIFILLITVDRFLVIKFPFGQYRISPNKAWILCGNLDRLPELSSRFLKV